MVLSQGNSYNSHIYVVLTLQQKQLESRADFCESRVFSRMSGRKHQRQANKPGMKPKESIQPDNCLVQMKRMIYWLQRIVILALVIAVAWTVYNHNKQEQKMSEQGQMITELSQKITELEQQLVQEEEWRGAVARKSEELNQKMSEQDQTITEQAQKITELQQQLVQEEEWRGAVARKSEVEDRMMQLKEHCDTFQATKASQSELDQLTNTVSMLSDTKVNMTDFNSLSSDVSDLRETVSTKADDDTVRDLTEGMHTVLENISHMSRQIDHINITLSTKANQQDVDVLTEKFMTLTTASQKTTVFEAAEEIIQALIKSKGDLFTIGIQVAWSTSKLLLS